jgi:Na+/proline symporter
MALQRMLRIGASLIFLGYIISIVAMQYVGVGMVIVGLTMLVRRELHGR